MKTRNTAILTNQPMCENCGDLMNEFSIICSECYELKIQWLERNDYQESDVLEDGDSREFVWSNYEMGSPEEDGYTNEMRKLYLSY